MTYQTLEMQIEERVLDQCNKLLIDYRVPPASGLSDEEAEERYGNSMFDRVFEDAYDVQDPPNRTNDYPLSDTEIVDLEHSRLIEIIRREQITIFNLEEQLTLDIPDYSVPLLYVCPSVGMRPVEYARLQQNCQAYFYPVCLRLVLNREQTAFPDLTITDTESLIREGLKYVLDRSTFLNMQGMRNGYDIPSRVVDHVAFVRDTVEGFMSPWEVFDYMLGFIVSEQATRAANVGN